MPKVGRRQAHADHGPIRDGPSVRSQAYRREAKIAPAYVRCRAYPQEGVTAPRNPFCCLLA